MREKIGVLSQLATIKSELARAERVQDRTAINVTKARLRELQQQLDAIDRQLDKEAAR